MRAWIDSEVGRLRRVIVHTPGAEIESMTPRTAQEVLYNDIIPMAQMRCEHEKMCRCLGMVATVHELRDLVRDALVDPATRLSLIDGLLPVDSLERRRSELVELDPEALVDTVIGGLASGRDTLTSFLSPRLFDFPPLPNLYFMRDGAAVIRDAVLCSTMAHEVRANEAALVRSLFASGWIRTTGCFNGGGFRIEGGDLIILRPNVLLVGVSERTSTQAVDALFDRISVLFPDRPLHVFAVLLPKERYAIHLDMVFTAIDRDLALVYHPTILGRDRAPVVALTHTVDGRRLIRPADGLFEALTEIGLPMMPILCGGGRAVVQEREQWLSGTNVLAVAPGVLIAYDCNEGTLAGLEAGGFSVVDVDSVLDGRCRLDLDRRTVVAVPGTELARGGGGIRCMTLPVERDPLDDAPLLEDS